jgi:hypothetical protein
MKTSETQLETTVAATVAGEDVSCGDFVALLNTTYELPSYLWDGCDASLRPHELVRLRMIPSEAGTPLKVFAVCLPFLYVKNTSGELKTLDLRRQQIVRLDRDCAKEVWDELKPGKKKI